MPKRRKKSKTSFSLQIKKGRKYKPIPRYSNKQKKQILLGTKRTPSLYAVKRKGGKVIEAKKL